MTSEQLKEQGNRYFLAKNFTEAIESYTKAIVRNPDIATYYTNRALCYLRLKQWEQAHDDCNRSLEIMACSFKAFYFKGKALFELSSLLEAQSCLIKAQSLAIEENRDVGDEISRILRQIKKKLFMEGEKERQKQEIELQTELSLLLMAEKEKRIEEVKKLQGDNGEDIDNLETSFTSKVEQLGQLFEQVDDRRKKREVPDVLCSRIHFGIMRDPVITPSGITYDRPDILESLRRLGNFDPVTRKEVRAEQLVPNLALKEVIDTFLEENAWAEDY